MHRPNVYLPVPYHVINRNLKINKRIPMRIDTTVYTRTLLTYMYRYETYFNIIRKKKYCVIILYDTLYTNLTWYVRTTTAPPRPPGVHTYTWVYSLRTGYYHTEPSLRSPPGVFWHYAYGNKIKIHGEARNGRFFFIFIHLLLYLYNKCMYIYIVYILGP